MPNALVAAAAKGLPENNPQLSGPISSLRRMVRGSIGRAIAPDSNREDHPAMNVQINRRSVLSASAVVTTGALAGSAALALPDRAAAMPIATAGQAASNGAQNGVDPKLKALKAAFEIEFRKMEEKNDIVSAAEDRYFATKPPRPEDPTELPIQVKRYLHDAATARMFGRDFREEDHPDHAVASKLLRASRDRQEAWSAACEAASFESGLPDAEKAQIRQQRRVDVVAARVFRFKAKSLEDVRVKVNVHRKWDWETFAEVLSADIKRITRAQRASAASA